MNKKTSVKDPDGTVYRVRSFFAAEQQMGDVLDALSLEKVNREN